MFDFFSPLEKLWDRAKDAGKAIKPFFQAPKIDTFEDFKSYAIESQDKTTRTIEDAIYKVSKDFSEGGPDTMLGAEGPIERGVRGGFSAVVNTIDELRTIDEQAKVAEGPLEKTLLVAKGGLALGLTAPSAMINAVSRATGSTKAVEFVYKNTLGLIGKAADKANEKSIDFMQRDVDVANRKLAEKYGTDSEQYKQGVQKNYEDLNKRARVTTYAWGLMGMIGQLGVVYGGAKMLKGKPKPGIVPYEPMSAGTISTVSKMAASLEYGEGLLARANGAIKPHVAKAEFVQWQKEFVENNIPEIARTPEMKEVMDVSVGPQSSPAKINRAYEMATKAMGLGPFDTKFKYYKQPGARPGVTQAAPLPDVTTRILEQIKGRKDVSKQFIEDLTRQPNVKQAERDIIRKTLEEFDAGKIDVQEFEAKVRGSLLPLEAKGSDVYKANESTYHDPESMISEGEFTPKYENTSLPSELRGDVENYYENIYESPIKTSAGNVHYNYVTDNYFAHTRIEDIPGDIRRVIELQSDLFQKGRLEGERKVNYHNRQDFEQVMTPEELEKYKAAYNLIPNEGANEFIEKMENKYESVVTKQRDAELVQLQPYRNIWHERIIREEVKKAAQDNKKTVLFPTGETAMKIEGLGGTEEQMWFVPNSRGHIAYGLTPESSAYKVGETVLQGQGEHPWIITEVLGDGKFKAIQKKLIIENDQKLYNAALSKGYIDEDSGMISDDVYSDRQMLKMLNDSNYTEQFDISGKVDTSNPIYKFYEKQVAKYLKREYGMERITDDQGVTWNKVDIQKLPKTILRQPTFAFKKEPGAGRPGIEEPADIYTENRMMQKDIKAIIKTDIKDIASGFKKGTDKYLGAISTRLKNINPEFKYKLRKMEFDLKQSALKKTESVMPFMEKVKDMEKTDRLDFDLARKNGDAGKINELVKKYGMEKEYTVTRKMLDKTYAEMKAVGYKVGYRQNYFPRVIKDVKGFLEHWQQQETWPLICEAIQGKEFEIKRNLEPDEKASLINTLLRGYSSGAIRLSETGAMKARGIDVVTPELNQFYMNTDAALLRYIEQSTNAIEARKFFGKGIDAEASIADSIGMFVLEQIEKGKITPLQEVELTNILRARFNPRGTSGLVSVYKNLEYLGTMGSPSSAITQIGDAAFSIYKGGAMRTGKAYIKAIAGKSKVTKADLGVDQIAEEFSDPSKLSKAVNTVFKLVGLESMDKLGKEAVINSTLEKFQKMAEKNDPKLEAKLKPVFEGETLQVIQDLKSGEITENVKLLAFNELLDVQPLALSEMPEQYLVGGQGRIFYMLKTYTLKLFDVYRNDVFQEIASGDKARVTQGFKNLMRLTAALFAMNATADLIKDVLFNRELDMEDLVVDNLFKLFGVSRFITWQARMDGIGTAIGKQILPPFSYLDSLYKDGRLIFVDPNKLIDEGFESAQRIPLVGKVYYWWLGKGAAKRAGKKKKSNKR